MFPRSLTALVHVAAICSATAFVSQPMLNSGASGEMAFVSRSRSTAMLMQTADEWDMPEDVPRQQPGFSDSRRERLQIEASAKSRFLTGDRLHMLRKEVLELRQELAGARQHASERRISELENAILKAQQVDAEFVYAVSLERMEEAEQKGNLKAVEKYREEAMAARSCLPQFNLEGLWVGKYGDHGYEMINVTYVGDILVARKVTGGKNVAKGQITFQADLGPNTAAPNKVLQPIELTDDATKQWGTKHLSRFNGIGQVSGQGFANSQWLDGQLILVGEYFSFAWVPLGHQVFFGRPSAELILKMLKKENKARSGQDQLMDYLERCMDETDLLEDDADHGEGLSFSQDTSDYFSQEGCFD